MFSLKAGHWAVELLRYRIVILDLASLISERGVLGGISRFNIGKVCV